MTVTYAAHNHCIVVDLPLDPRLPAMVVEPECSLSGLEVIGWLQQHGFKDLVPFFEAANPRLVGAELVSFEKDWFMSVSSRLSMRDIKYIDERRQLGRAIMQLRADSYS
mmetsp:Transcript_8132/g.24285  ORF Transcript_8132/g.24285 Transcript_8132/m.24285 type:complete len:109 (-) Transcript_8132:315-641(-)